MFQILVISILITLNYGEDNNLIVQNTPEALTIANHVKTNIEADPFATRLLTEIWTTPPEQYPCGPSSYSVLTSLSL